MPAQRSLRFGGRQQRDGRHDRLRREVGGPERGPPGRLPLPTSRRRRRWRSGKRSGRPSAPPIVKRIKDNKWGMSADGKTLTGPEGFTIDLSEVPRRLERHRGPHRHRRSRSARRWPQSGTAGRLRQLHQRLRGAVRLLQQQGRLQGLDRQDPQGRLHRRRTTATTRPGPSRSSTSSSTPRRCSPCGRWARRPR